MGLSRFAIAAVLAVAFAASLVSAQSHEEAAILSAGQDDLPHVATEQMLPSAGRKMLSSGSPKKVVVQEKGRVVVNGKTVVDVKKIVNKIPIVIKPKPVVTKPQPKYIYKVVKKRVCKTSYVKISKGKGKDKKQKVVKCQIVKKTIKVPVPTKKATIKKYSPPMLRNASPPYMKKYSPPVKYSKSPPAKAYGYKSPPAKAYGYKSPPPYKGYDDKGGKGKDDVYDDKSDD